MFISLYMHSILPLFYMLYFLPDCSLYFYYIYGIFCYGRCSYFDIIKYITLIRDD